jgi:hypothetical protein
VPINYEDTMKEFIEFRGWNDELILDEEGEKVFLSTGIDIDGQSGRAIVEARNDDIFEFYFYYIGFTVKESNMDQMEILLSKINRTLMIGCLEVVGDINDRRVRWRHRVDFEGASPTGMTVSRNFQPGWATLESYINPITTVALTKQGAADALSEHEAEVEKARAAEKSSTNAGDGVPDEL